MTILIAFHQSHYLDFKACYCEQVLKSWRAEFPGLVSYSRFVEYIPSVLIPLAMYLQTCCLGTCTGLSFIDSTSLDAYLNQHIHSHKLFTGLVARGKTSTGWFFGFKLHLVVNDRAISCRSALHPETWITVSHCQSWSESCLASSLAIKAIFLSPWPNSCAPCSTFN